MRVVEERDVARRERHRAHIAICAVLHPHVVNHVSQHVRSGFRRQAHEVNTGELQVRSVKHGQIRAVVARRNLHIVVKERIKAEIVAHGADFRLGRARGQTVNANRADDIVLHRKDDARVRVALAIGFHALMHGVFHCLHALTVALHFAPSHAFRQQVQHIQHGGFAAAAQRRVLTVICFQHDGQFVTYLNIARPLLFGARQDDGKQLRVNAHRGRIGINRAEGILEGIAVLGLGIRRIVQGRRGHCQRLHPRGEGLQFRQRQGIRAVVLRIFRRCEDAAYPHQDRQQQTEHPFHHRQALLFSETI